MRSCLVLSAVIVISLASCSNGTDKRTEVVTDTATESSDEPCRRPGRTPGDIAGRAENFQGAVVDIARIDCRPASRNSEVRRGSIINTEDDPAAILFHLTDPVLWCDALYDVQLQVFPNNDYVIEWFGGKGTTWCGKSPDARDQAYKIGDRIEIHVFDPIFGVVLDGEQTIIKMLDGNATVILDGELRSELSAGEQLVISGSGESISEDLELTAEDDEAISRLREVVPLPDLTIKFLDFVASDGRCEITYSLTNGGKADAGNTITRLEIEGEVSEESVGRISAGDTVEGSVAVDISCPFVPDLSGRLTADADNTVAESDEENNQEEILVLG